MPEWEALNGGDRISFGPHDLSGNGLNRAAQEPTGRESKPGGNLLVVDDEPARKRSLHATLFGMGFDVGEASSGDQAVALCRIIRYDVVLLSVSLRGKVELGTCTELRRLLPGTAILAMSPSDDEQSRVEALDAGADDFVTPSRMRELTARVRAALRTLRTYERDDTRIVIGEIDIFPARRIVRKANHPVHLTPKEFALLHFLMAHAGFPLTHAQLLSAAWGRQFSTQVEYLRTFVRQLRKKLEDDPGIPRYLLTESHVGYRFVAPAGAPPYKTAGASRQ